MTDKRLSAFKELLDIMDQLREKCPWDREQTFESIKTLTIEEVYELADAIDRKNMDDIRKELGDLMLHIVFYAKMASEKEAFEITDVLDTINKKLIYRHPHVFSSLEVNGSDEVSKNWEELKLKEKDGNTSVLGGIPASLPALIKACRIQQKARGVGFDWEIREQVWDKIGEELGELKNEIDQLNQDKIEAEFGDLLFSVINAARLYGVNPENALERTNRKFISRFNYLESQTIGKGISLKDMTLAEMEEIWQTAKKFDK